MAATAATSASLFNSSKQIVSTSSTSSATSFWWSSLPINYPIKRRLIKIRGETTAVAAALVADAPVAEFKDYVLPRWTDFDLGRAPVYWKTMNGLPLPPYGERLKLFYNPTANTLARNEDYGIAFNGGFNHPIMCGSEPRVMLQKVRKSRSSFLHNPNMPRKACLIFSFTNGVDWDGPYKLQFQVPKAWRSRPTYFFTEGLAKELSKEGACDKAIFPDTNMVVTRCAMIDNLTVEGGGRCSLDFVPGCTDPSSPLFNPLANVDDGSCPPYVDSEDQPQYIGFHSYTTRFCCASNS